MSTFKPSQLFKHVVLVAVFSLGFLNYHAKAFSFFSFAYSGPIVRFSDDQSQPPRTGSLDLIIPQGANTSFTGSIRWDDTGEIVPVRGKIKADGTGTFKEKTADGLPLPGAEKQIFRVNQHLVTGGALSSSGVATAFRLSYLP